MGKQTLGQRMVLLMQSNDLVTIREDSVPLLEIVGANALNPSVNFLRCGVPYVQLVFEPRKSAEDRARQPHMWGDEKKRVEDQFTKVALYNGEFVLDFNDMNWTVLVSRASKK